MEVKHYSTFAPLLSTQAQYDDEMRDARTLRQKVGCLPACCHGFPVCLPVVMVFLFVVCCLYHMFCMFLQREAESKEKVLHKKCEKRMMVSILPPVGGQIDSFM